jgi:hypothetical protein
MTLNSTSRPLLTISELTGMRNYSTLQEQQKLMRQRLSCGRREGVLLVLYKEK